MGCRRAALATHTQSRRRPIGAAPSAANASGERRAITRSPLQRRCRRGDPRGCPYLMKGMFRIKQRISCNRLILLRSSGGGGLLYCVATDWGAGSPSAKICLASGRGHGGGYSMVRVEPVDSALPLAAVLRLCIKIATVKNSTVLPFYDNIFIVFN
jgi:hypothetical protein